MVLTKSSGDSESDGDVNASSDDDTSYNTPKQEKERRKTIRRQVARTNSRNLESSERNSDDSTTYKTPKQEKERRKGNRRKAARKSSANFARKSARKSSEKSSDSSEQKNRGTNAENSGTPSIKPTESKQVMVSTKRNCTDKVAATPRRNPKRSCREISVINNDETGERGNLFEELRLKDILENDSDYDIDDTDSSRSLMNDDDDEQYLSRRQVQSAKDNARRPKGAIRRSEISLADSNPDSEDDIHDPECREPFNIGDIIMCPYCLAEKYGTDSYCCRTGTVFIPPMKAIPGELHDLIFGNSPQSTLFKKSIMTYNTLFSMASLQRHSIPAAPHGLPVQKVQGVVDAYPSATLPFDATQPAFANFYVYHGQTAIDMRMKMFHNVDRSIVEKLQRVMEKNNELVKNYCTMKEVMDDIEEKSDTDMQKYVRMKIVNACDFDKEKLQGHEGIYRTREQGSDYVAVFYTASVEQHDIELPGLIIYPRRSTKSNIRPIHYWNPLVDPLSYPLMFPYGEFGYQSKKFPLYKKKEKKYWSRLNEYWTDNPETSLNSECIIDKTRVELLARSDANQQELSAEVAEGGKELFNEGSVLGDDSGLIDEECDMDESDYIEGIYPIRSECNPIVEHELARQQHVEANLEDPFDVDMREYNDDLDDVFYDAQEYIEEEGADVSEFMDSVEFPIDPETKHQRSKAIKVMNLEAKKKGLNLGVVTLLPQDVPGSPRWLQQKFLNAVTLSNTLGPIDLFITCTCNTSWPEIKKNLKKGQTWADRPELVNNVFKEKLKELLKLIIGEKHKNPKKRKKGIFGNVRWYSYSIEFQQRGPPHAHMVFSLEKHIKTVAQIEKVVQAQIPTDNDSLRELVEQFMIHKPCEGDCSAYCRPTNKYKNSTKCKKKFPAEFSSSTKLGDRHYPEYIRPDNGVKSRKNSNADNRYVVPYNATLLSAWVGHINVEVVSTLKVVKYIFKYLFKGFDRVLVEIVTNADNIDVSQMTIDGHLIYPKGLKIPPGALEKRKAEVVKLLKQMNVPLEENGEKVLVYDELVLVQDMRALTPCEAAWDLAGFPRHGCSHKVLEQTVHEEDEEPLFFDPAETEDVFEKIVQDKINTKLKAWFRLNQEDCDARDIPYDHIPLYYTFKGGKWVRKKRYDRNIITRVLSVNPRNREAFAIRLLSQNKKGCTSFEDLRTVDGNVFTTFTEAAKALRLMNDQKEWQRCLEEASACENPCKLRRLFMQILTSNDVANPLELYQNFREEFFERRDEWSDETKEAQALYHMQSYLVGFNKTLYDYNLPGVVEQNLPRKGDLHDDSGRGIGHIDKSWAKSLIDGLQEEQREVFDEIFNSVMAGNRNIHGKNAYFLQGSGGTGKTVLMKALYYNLIAAGKKVACVAHTGIAAGLLPNGSTAHRLFHIPIRVEKTMCCQVELDQREAEYLSQFDCIIWDEATMTDKRVFDAVHRLMTILHYETANRPFAGVHFILAGDWKQTLPIVRQVRSVGVVDYTLLLWKMWKEGFKVFELTKNRRAVGDPKYASYLEDVGLGRNNIAVDSCRAEDQLVELPAECLVGSENEVLQLLNTEEHVLLSIDTFDEQTGIKALDPETYHGVTPSGYPPHRLTLKIGAIVILLRNINVALGLSNGTRLIVTKIGRDILHLEHVEKRKKGENKVLLQRMLFAQDGKDLACEITFTRKQFPIRLAFCITCNRAQGQTLRRAGLVLRSPCFSHGQLYVALSRVRTRKDLFIYNGSTDPSKTNNVTFPKIFSLVGEKIMSFSQPRLAKTLTTICDFSDNAESLRIILPNNISLPKKKSCLAIHADEESSDDDIDYQERMRIYLQLGNENRSEHIGMEEFEVEDHNPQEEVELQQALLTYMRKHQNDTEEKQIRHDDLEDRIRSKEAKNVEFDLGGNLPIVWRPNNRPVPAPALNLSEIMFDSGSDLEYDDLFTSTEREGQKQKGIRRHPDLSLTHRGKHLRLEQIENNCFANTAVQALYRLFKNDILYYEDADPIMLELQRIAKGSGNTMDLLRIAPGSPLALINPVYYNDGNQHDSDEYLFYIINLVNMFRKSVEVEEAIEDKCVKCKKTSNPSAPIPYTCIEIRAGDEKIQKDGLTTLQDFVCSVETTESIQKSCDCRINPLINHTRKTTYCIPDSTKFLIVKFVLYTSDRFVKRRIEYQDEFDAFGCMFEPIVMMEHKGTRSGGHYVAYVKNVLGWLRVDATRTKQLARAPDMTRIKIVVLEKTGTVICKDQQLPTTSRASTLKTSMKHVIEIYKGDMFEVTTEAIVNAANSRLHNGGGVCKQIFEKAGRKKMKEACSKVLRNMNALEIPPGEAVVTPSFDLANGMKARKCVIHTAAPQIIGPKVTVQDEIKLRECYMNTCRRAAENNLKKIVFPVLGIGLFNYDKEEGIAVALQAVLLYFELYPNSCLQHVVLAAYTEETYNIALRLNSGKDTIRITDTKALGCRTLIERNFKKRRTCEMLINFCGTLIIVASFINEEPVPKITKLSKDTKAQKKIGPLAIGTGELRCAEKIQFAKTKMICSIWTTFNVAIISTTMWILSITSALIITCVNWRGVYFEILPDGILQLFAIYPLYYYSIQTTITNVMISLSCIILYSIAAIKLIRDDNLQLRKKSIETKLFICGIMATIPLIIDTLICLPMMYAVIYNRKDIVVFVNEFWLEWTEIMASSQGWLILLIIPTVRKRFRQHGFISNFCKPKEGNIIVNTL